MNDFKGRHFESEIVLWAVRWYCRYGISYRDLEEMMAERGIRVDHGTIYRRVQKYAPAIEKRMRWQWRRPRSDSWRVDETYIKMRGKWAYLHRAVDKFGDRIDFYLSAARNAKAAKRFLGKALKEGLERLGATTGDQHGQGPEPMLSPRPNRRPKTSARATCSIVRSSISTTSWRPTTGS